MTTESSRPSMTPTPELPGMVAGYGITTDLAAVTPSVWREIETRLTAARNYWVASTRPDGRPHAMPVWGLWLDGACQFSTDPKSVKGRNLAANPEVVVHLESGDDCVILEGAVVPMTDPTERVRFADRYDSKYGVRPDPADPTTLIFSLRPRTALTWQEKDFPTSAVRWRFGAG